MPPDTCVRVMQGELEVGEVVQGTVVFIAPYGAFVEVSYATNACV